MGHDPWGPFRGVILSPKRNEIWEIGNPTASPAAQPGAGNKAFVHQLRLLRSLPCGYSCTVPRLPFLSSSAPAVSSCPDPPDHPRTWQAGQGQARSEEGRMCGLFWPGTGQASQRCFFPARVSCPCWPQKNGDRPRWGGAPLHPSTRAPCLLHALPWLLREPLLSVPLRFITPQMPGKMQIKGRFGYFSEISNGATHVWSGLSAESAGERSTLKYLHFFSGIIYRGERLRQGLSTPSSFTWIPTGTRIPPLRRLTSILFSSSRALGLAGVGARLTALVA